jgi:hypothetical protein
MEMIDMTKLEEDVIVAVMRCWDKDTTHDPDNWTEENMAYGQCAPTALVVQDYLGGNIRQGTTKSGHKHFWNYVQISDTWFILDVSEVQFVDDEINHYDFKSRSRNSLLKIKHVKDRYEILHSRVEKLLEEWKDD